MYTTTNIAFFCENRRTCPTKRAGIRAHPIEGEAVLYDESNQTTFHLNETAFLIWEACDGHRTLEDQAEILQEHYEVEAATAQDDVDQIVAFLADARLIGVEVRCGSSGA